jgi:hypothetical protein
MNVVTLAQRPDLVEAVPGVLASRWPVYLLAGRPGHDVDLTILATEVPGNQVVLLDGDDVLAIGLSIPLDWDGTPDGLPSGWDGALTAGAKLISEGRRGDAACAISLTLRPEATGRGLAAGMLRALKAAAGANGARALIGPVRPTYKSRYPLIPMAEYATWRTPDGRVFDPWLRAHLDLGAEQLAVGYPSMTVSGTVAQWEEWTGLPLPASGRYVIPGGLEPLEVDRDDDLGLYREANVWVAHPIA